MPLDFAISQLLVVSDRSGPVVVAQADGVAFEREEWALRAAARFGSRPKGARVPSAMFAADADKTTVAVVQVADGPAPGDDPPLGFRFLFLDRKLYAALGDPFAIADRFPPDWFTRGSLPTLEWPPEPLPTRTVAHIANVLKHGDGPLLLGMAQALLDGGRVALVRTEPDEKVLRAVWQLLPDHARAELRPATFAFDGDLDFHAVAAPTVPPRRDPPYLTEEQAKSYPEGRYELAVQIAAENLDQRELDRLFARRSSRDVLRTALVIVAVAVVAAVASKLFF